MTNAQQQQQQLTIAFTEWFNDGNVILLEGGFATQDTNYNNRLTLEELKAYFIREFYPQETLRYEVENSGEWVSINDLYINCEDGRITDEGYLHYGDVYETNITDKEGIEYLEQMSAEDLELLWKFFPSTIEAFKMHQIRENAKMILARLEDEELNVVEQLVNEIIALTK